MQLQIHVFYEKICWLKPADYSYSAVPAEIRNRKKDDRDMERTQITHPIPPVYDGNSELLILGSFPSVKSREAAFFYGHPRNRF